MNSAIKNHTSSSKVGIFVDSANMYRNGGARMQYDVLREYACRDHSDPVRLNAYVSYDARRAKVDYDYRKKAEGFHSVLRDIGFKVIIKEVKWYEDIDEEGKMTLVPKANADLDLAVDALLQSENLDRVLLASGDGDFVQVVRALQNKGCRVEVVALDNVSSALRQEADSFMSGYLIPNLIPTPTPAPEWGQVGSWVRGWCYYYDDTKGIGFMRYLSRIDKNLWLTDKRKYPDSPFETSFFHFSKLQDESLTNRLPSRDFIFEFRLAASERGPDKLNATDIRLVSEL
ncbi:LabA-like NYN domain-containing protein [Methylomagnum ishizawai]|uniref:LabA-like NYN domain-containing protein n=1 Tax=Methylomagnum ishizawai TaxID=1760988 RepID=UPI000A160BCB|nr:NYN domain-containing protein [Methylomagnum ishizawai]